MPRSRGLVYHTADRAIPEPGNQAAEAFGAVGELLGLTCRDEMDVQAGFRDINAKDMIRHPSPPVLVMRALMLM